MSLEAESSRPTSGPSAVRELGWRTNGKPISVNWHVWPWCNYRCSFCFATFRDTPQALPRQEALLVPRLLREAGTEKITFAGGEPTLCPHLSELLEESKDEGLVTMVVTNASRLTDEFLDVSAPWIDWIALSVDSGSNTIEADLGRGFGSHVDQVRKGAQRIKARGIHLKVNTTVTAATWREDMHALIQELNPERWKVFQVLPIRGENDDFGPQGWISRGQFRAFLERHTDLHPVAETNEDMLGSYVMLDPLGRFFQNPDGRYAYSDAILEVGVEPALAQVGWDSHRFVVRGGLYDWNRSGRERE